MNDDPTRSGEGGPAEDDEIVADPGVDLHIFETEWAAAWEDVHSDPAESLPVLDDIIGRMLESAGYAPDDEVARAGDEREVLDRYPGGARRDRGRRDRRVARRRGGCDQLADRGLRGPAHPARGCADTFDEE